MSLMLLIGIMLVSSMLIAGQNKGTKEMVLFGGRKGNVSFPHHRHQTILGDCNICHNLFPKVTGSILDLKVNKKLKNKQVMEQCSNCHKAKEKAGDKAGPTRCKACHNK